MKDNIQQWRIMRIVENRWGYTFYSWAIIDNKENTIEEWTTGGRVALLLTKPRPRSEVEKIMEDLPTEDGTTYEIY